jgi:hypothetical protein
MSAAAVTSCPVGETVHSSCREGWATICHQCRSRMCNTHQSGNAQLLASINKIQCYLPTCSRLGSSLILSVQLHSQSWYNTQSNNNKYSTCTAWLQYTPHHAAVQAATSNQTADTGCFCSACSTQSTQVSMLGASGYRTLVSPAVLQARADVEPMHTLILACATSGPTRATQALHSAA